MPSLGAIIEQREFILSTDSRMAQLLIYLALFSFEGQQPERTRETQRLYMLTLSHPRHLRRDVKP